MLCQCFFQVFLNLERKSVLEKTGNILSVVAMTVTDREEVAVTEVKHVRVG